MALPSKEADKAITDAPGAKLSDLSTDILVQCAQHLSIQDLASMATTCKQMREAVYVDSIWEQQCRKRWPPKLVNGALFQYCGGRKAYQDRHSTSQKFKFQDPLEVHFVQPLAAHVNHIVVEDNSFTVAQGASIKTYGIESQELMYSLVGHKAQVTCMRLVPSTGLLSCRGSDDGGALLVTSGMDHTIRVWRKACTLRTFRGHSGPVTTLSSSLLGGPSGTPTLASGGMDGTIRLWAISSSGQKRGSSPLLKTFHGHELAVKQLVVTEYNPSLLLSAGKDMKLRVWDVASASSSLGMGGALVGSTRGPGVPVGLACRGSTCFMGGGSSLMLIDLRSMQTIATFVAHQCGILSFATSVASNVVCTGGSEEMAKLWDLRNVEEPFASLGGHFGGVKFTHVDGYKVVTGSLKDSSVHIWDVETGDQISTLENLTDKLSALAVNGTRIITGGSNGNILFRDFANCTLPIATQEDDTYESSKFWETGFNETE